VRLRAAALVTLLAASGTAACGPTKRGDDAAGVAERFHAALAESDGAAACAELTGETASELESQEGEPCAEAVLALELPSGGSAASTKVYVTSAAVTLAAGGTDFLDEGPDGWKVSAAGCRPTAPGMPYDCELEG
jgi:hypothetical protein